MSIDVLWTGELAPCQLPDKLAIRFPVYVPQNAIMQNAKVPATKRKPADIGCMVEPASIQ